MIGGFIGKAIGGPTFEATATAGAAAGTGTAAATGRGIAVASASASGAGAANATGGKIAQAAGTASGLGTASAGGAKLGTAAGAATGLGQASGVGSSFTLFYLRPGGDIATNGWTDQADGTVNIYQAIDEASANDADYVQSPVRESATTDLTVRLFEGSTLIAEWEHTDLAEAFVDAEQTLTTPQYEAISNFANLFAEFDDGVDPYRFALSDPLGDAAPPVKVKYRYEKLAA